MYAVVEIGGHQWKVEPGTRLDVNRIPSEVGGQHTLERVLLASDGQQVQLGRPYVKGAKVICEVLAHKLGPKAISYHFRRRENWRKTVGHRQPLTRLVVKEILLSGEGVPAEVPARAATPSRPRKSHTEEPSASSLRPNLTKRAPKKTAAPNKSS